MFFSGATEPQEQHPLSLFMSYLSCPTISFVLYKVAFWECQDQTHIFLVFSTQSGVKQLVRLQEAQSAQTGKGEEEGKVNEQREGVMGPGDQGGRRRSKKKKKKRWREHMVVER